MATRDTAAREVEGDILERLPYGVVVVDERFRPQFVSGPARTMLERGAAAVDEQLADAQGPLRTFAAELFRSDQALVYDVVAVGASTLALSGVSARGEETAVIAVADVTERERRERAERHFIENAAHELRTPVAAIVSVVEALDGGAKDAPELRDRFLGHLRSHSARLVDLSTSLLALARVQSGGEAAQLELVPLREFVENATVDLRGQNDVALTVDVPDRLAALADRQLLRLALANVTTNAIKNTFVGEIRLRGRRVASWAELEIRDTGIGMSVRDRDAAFSRFHRGTASEGEGFGLGLAIAADAIDAMHGELRLDSAPEAGTTVKIRLPAAELR